MFAQEGVDEYQALYDEVPTRNGLIYLEEARKVLSEANGFSKEFVTTTSTTVDIPANVSVEVEHNLGPVVI